MLNLKLVVDCQNKEFLFFVDVSFGWNIASKQEEFMVFVFTAWKVV